ncbi:MAG: DNA/RNA non-specific endonuclease [Pirellulales bacterium]
MTARLSELHPPVLESIRHDHELMEEIESHTGQRAGDVGRLMEGVSSAESRRMFATFAGQGGVPDSFSQAGTFEAIILRRGRPSFLVQHDSYVIPNDEQVWTGRLQPSRQALESAIRSVGRIEVSGHPELDWIGTGWLASPDLVVTNRHVANEFAFAGGRGFVFRPGLGGGPMHANIDFKEEFGGTDEAAVDVVDILFIAGQTAGQPDMAVLKLKTPVDRTPLSLADSSTATGEFIALIGYPARDDRRNDPAVARDIFRDIYEKKRLAPGKQIDTGLSNAVVFEHDCTSLGGASGAALIDVGTGKTLGLHFGGRFEQSNFAVRAEVVSRVLGSVQRTTTAFGFAAEAPAADPDEYADRPGYEAEFLGSGDDLFVPLPEVRGTRQRDLLRQTRGPNRGSDELRYMHFSIKMSKSRKLPFFTACNIDGDSLRRPRRGRDVWRFDPRIPDTAQVGNDLYADNKLDRGHQVRRLDPVWGSSEEAKLAELDTFHFTNSCPQHARLNQGKSLWAGLEDYILDNTDEKNLRISVFTGPVFDERDLVYRDTKIPEEYWKVVVNVRDDGRLSATAYVLSQGQFMDDIEFAFGPFRTFQVPIRKVEAKTGLHFGPLSDFDPVESIEGPDAAIEVDRLERIVLG